jgi:hypothetical protein
MSSYRNYHKYMYELFLNSFSLLCVFLNLLHIFFSLCNLCIGQILKSLIMEKNRDFLFRHTFIEEAFILLA